MWPCREEAVSRRSALPSEFCREALPRALKAGFGPRFFSLKLQLLATLLGLASAPSSGPGDWAFPLAMGALEGLGNTLSFRLAFRLRWGGGGEATRERYQPISQLLRSRPPECECVCFFFFGLEDDNLRESSPMLFRALTSAAAL